MPPKKRFRGYLSLLIKDYRNHCIENLLPPPKEESYVLVVAFRQERPTPQCKSAGIELRLRTTEDLTNDDSWAVRYIKFSSLSYVKHLLALEIKQYAKKGITIDSYVYSTPTEPIPPDWKKVWQPYKKKI